MKLRSISDAVKFIKEQDADTAVNENLLRTLIADRKIKSISAGNRRYVDIDTLQEELKGAMK